VPVLATCTLQSHLKSSELGTTIKLQAIPLHGGMVRVHRVFSSAPGAARDLQKKILFIGVIEIFLAAAVVVFIGAV
jgi:hypothetical protein